MVELIEGQKCDWEKKKLGSLLCLAPPGRRRTSASPTSPDCHVSAQIPEQMKNRGSSRLKWNGGGVGEWKKNLDDN